MRRGNPNQRKSRTNSRKTRSKKIQKELRSKIKKQISVLKQKILVLESDYSKILENGTFDEIKGIMAQLQYFRTQLKTAKSALKSIN